jgi:L-ascorbate metabolism protein UlaG (beta-lactamase superfamily)
MFGPRLARSEVPGQRITLNFPTYHNPVKVTPLYAGSFLIEEGNKAFYVDPARPANFKGLPSADVILITDIGSEHLDSVSLSTISTRGTEIIAPAAVVKILGRGHALANGEITNLLGWFITAVPLDHPNRGLGRGRGNGYVLTYGSKSFYVSGETQGGAEMRTLKGIDVAFVCINRETLSPAEAADAVKAFHPGVVVPYLYGGSDPRIFAKDLEGTGIDVRLLDWYPQTPQ